MVKRKTLLFIAGLVWVIAGFNILKIGILSYIGYVYFPNLICSLLIFFLFWFFVFNKLVVKHTVRITGYNEEKNIFGIFLISHHF